MQKKNSCLFCSQVLKKSYGQKCLKDLNCDDTKNLKCTSDRNVCDCSNSLEWDHGSCRNL